MTDASNAPDPEKDRVVAALSTKGSALKKYQAFFVGQTGLGPLLRYELTMMLVSGLRGAVGYLLRKKLFPGLFASAGQEMNFGPNISLRCPGNMYFGDRVTIDDNCSLDARGARDENSFVIGGDTHIARSSVLLVKQGYLRIGSHCSIGAQNFIGAISGIEIGNHVTIADQCYIGGGRYKNALGAGPMVEQGMYTKGPIVLGHDVWMGAGARVLDGVRIGDGAIIEVGAVVTADVPPNAIMSGIPARQISER